MVHLHSMCKYISKMEGLGPLYILTDFEVMVMGSTIDPQ